MKKTLLLVLGLCAVASARSRRETGGDPFSAWTNWGSCQGGCGTQGYQMRTRQCKAYPPLACQGKPTQEARSCQLDGTTACDGSWGKWSPWGSCSSQCGGGVRKSERKCSSSLCEGKAHKEESCNPHQCCTPWSSWGSCSITCGSNNGTANRERRCTVYQHGVASGGYASKPEKIARECSYLAVQCPTWGEWGEWCECSKSCGGGLQKRHRVCTDYNGCKGDKDEEQECNTHSCPTYSEWQPWEACDKGCGGGTRERERKCDIDPKFCIETNLNDPSCICVGDQKDIGECNTHICASWAEWNEWAQCSKDCGGGKRERPRICMKDASFCTADEANNAACKCEGHDNEVDPCNEHVCPRWDEWSEWCECTATCNGGRRDRTRECIVDETFCTDANTDDASCVCCGSPKQDDLCNTHLCPFWGPWEPWGECDKDCNGGTKPRDRPCINDGGYCKKINKNLDSDHCTCDGDDKSKTECHTHKCATWEPWGEWQPCSNDCGGGTRIRNRECKNDPSFCDIKENKDHPSCFCDGFDMDKGECNMHKCPEWTSWTPWADCSETCGGGLKDRQRQCDSDGVFCSDAANTDSTSCKCAGDDGGQEQCNDHKCPEYGSWSPWSECTKPCAGGTKTRKRPCQVDKTFCSANPNDASCKCVGDEEETTTCNDHFCAEWTPWEQWPPCSATCGGGTHKRTRNCKYDKSHCVDNVLHNDDSCKCPGDKEESKSCEEQLCPEWSTWEQWKPCSVTCGGGEKERSRVCETDGNYCTDDKKDDPSCVCPGTDGEKNKCNDYDCPVWETWSPWSECSVTCSKGEQTRNRNCNMDTAFCVGDKVNGKECKCPGDKQDTKPCDAGECFQWTVWGQWYKCTRVCGGGSRNRTRTCPQPGACPGLKHETSFCNQMPCPDWGSWSQWSSCSESCGNGQRVRNRACPIENACSPGKPFGTEVCGTEPCPTWTSWTLWSDCDRSCGDGNRKRQRECKPIDGCLGRGIDVEPCRIKNCVLTTHWSAWSPCTETCGQAGTQTRSKAMCPDPGCPAEHEKQECERHICPVWQEWGPWSDCSKSCGAGSRTHARNCAYNNGTEVERGCIGKGEEIDPLPCNNFPCKWLYFW